jgi:hypothetical protein
VQSAVVDQFGVDLGSVEWFHVWPVGCFGDQSSWSKIDNQGYALDRHVTRAAVERLVGERLLDLPEHEILHQQVLDLGGGVWDRAYRSVFDAFPVDELPPPHNPSSCQHHERFKAILRELPKADGAMDRSLEAGQLFLESLSSEDIDNCRYHQANWRAIADESVRILQRSGDRAATDDYIDSAGRSKLSQKEGEWLVSLFADPIFIGGGSYTNGQHRGCALRFSGAEKAAIHVDDEFIGDICVDWTYGGGG